MKKGFIYSIFTLLAGLLLLGWTGCAHSPRHSFEITETSFLIDGKETVLRSGELHFDRIPLEYWRHRLQMAKAMGLNTISIYLFWNKVEPNPDQIDRQNLADMTEFVKMCQEEGLWVILRPGPYVCAEWDMGGLPWWLLAKDSVRLRSRDPYFLERARKYLHLVGKTLAPLQVTEGGPILMVQVENEYGHYGTDTEYLGLIKQYVTEAGFRVPLFQCDYYARFVDRRDDLFCMANFGTSEDPAVALDSLRSVMPAGPLMVAEYYPGWLDHWGEPHGTVPTEKVLKNLRYFLDKGCSFNFYMLHGGTSFGMWAGANHPTQPGGRYQPTTSSYDYDAPIGEAGWDTPKYHAIRELIAQYLPDGETLPEVPARPEVMELPEFTLSESALLTDNLRQIVSDETPRNMEAYNQGFGCIVYKTTLPAGGAATLQFDRINDFAVVLLDNTPLTTIDRRLGETSCQLPARNAETKLTLVVEAMGRVNSDSWLPDRKGILGEVLLKDAEGTRTLRNWNVCPVVLDNEKAPQQISYTSSPKPQGPAFYRAQFEAGACNDTFLDMSNWGKGLVWVNGHCLGRYWNIGPTQTMYLPGPWLRKGTNEIVVLDLLTPRNPTVYGRTTPILDRLQTRAD